MPPVDPPPLTLRELLCYFVEPPVADVDLPGAQARAMLAARLTLAEGALHKGEPLTPLDQQAIRDAYTLLTATRVQATEEIATALEAQGCACSSDLVIGCVEMAALVAVLPLRRHASGVPTPLSREGWLALCSDAYDRGRAGVELRKEQGGIVQAVVVDQPELKTGDRVRLPDGRVGKLCWIIPSGREAAVAIDGLAGTFHIHPRLLVRVDP